MGDDFEIVREALAITEAEFGMKYPAAECALDRIQAENARLREMQHEREREAAEELMWRSR